MRRLRCRAAADIQVCQLATHFEARGQGMPAGGSSQNSHDPPLGRAEREQERGSKQAGSNCVANKSRKHVVVEPCERCHCLQAKKQVSDQANKHAWTRVETHLVIMFCIFQMHLIISYQKTSKQAKSRFPKHFPLHTNAFSLAASVGSHGAILYRASVRPLGVACKLSAPRGIYSGFRATLHPSGWHENSLPFEGPTMARCV